MLGGVAVGVGLFAVGRHGGDDPRRGLPGDWPAGSSCLLLGQSW